MLSTSPKLKVSYPHIFEAKGYADNPDKYYDITLMIDKNNPGHMDWLKEVHAACKSTLEEGWPDVSKRPKIPLVGHEKSPIKDADKTVDGKGFILSEKNPEYKGHYLIRAASKESNGPVIIVDAGRVGIMNSALVYGGCFCKVNVNPYPRLNPANPGVSMGLNGVQKMEDGESFGSNRPPIEDMFGVEGASGGGQPGGADPFADGSGGGGQGGPDLDPFGSDDVPF